MEGLVNSIEVSEVQGELVRLNLRIKSMTASFSNCVSREEMEFVNISVRQQMELMRQNLDKLRRLASKQKTTESKKMLLSDAESHADELASCQRRFREANLQCIGELEKRGRDALFASEVSVDGFDETDGDGLRKRQRLQRDKEDLVLDSGRASDQLISISRQLADTVQRSALAVEELAESSRVVNETNEEFKAMGAVLGHSRRLITKYGRREVTDKVLIFFAALFFFACVFYILRKRVLGPLDPFSLMWSTITTLISTLLALLGFS